MEESHSEDLLTIVGLMGQHFTHRIPQMSSKLNMCLYHAHTYNALAHTVRTPFTAIHGVCVQYGGVLTHDASFNLYEDILLLAGREAGTERWLLFTEPVPTLKEAQLDFLRFLLHGRYKGWVGRGGGGGV